MYNIVLSAIERGRAVIFLMGVILLSGIAVLINIPKEAEPDIPIPFIYVSVIHPGISPEDAERLIVRPLEKELMLAEGLDEVLGFGGQNYGAVIVKYDVDVDVDEALLETTRLVDLVKPKFPKESEEPLIKEVNVTAFPALFVALSGKVSERELIRRAKTLKNELENLPNVLGAEIMGDREEQLEVTINPARMEAYQISHNELYAIIANNNRVIPAGQMDTGLGRFTISVPGLFETAEDVFKLPVKVRGDAVVTLSDIAEIRRTYKDQQTRTFYNGDPALILKVKRKTGTNVLEMTDQVRERTIEYTANWPENIYVNFSFDQSSHVFNMINSLQSSIANAIVLVMLIVIGALGFRSAMMVGIAIPTSFMMSFVLLSLFGNSLNMMVMFSLILCVGILVDSSIVIVEYADRKMAEGLDRKQAYAQSAERMFFPILSSTATTLAAFTPLLFWPGVSGEFMSYLPRTLIFVLTSALVMALFFLPAIGGLYGKTEQAGDRTLTALSAANPDFIIDETTLTGRYLRILERLMVNPLRTFVALMLIFASIIITYRFFEKDTLYFAEIEPRQAIVLVRARGNLSLDDTEKLTRSVEKEVMQIKGIQAALTQFGPNIAYGGSGNNENPTDLIGSIFIEFQHFTVRESSKKIIQKIKDRTKDFPGIIVEIREQEDGPPIGKDIQLEIRSNNYEGLVDIAEKANAKFKSFDELLTDVEDNRSSPGIEWKIKVDREKAGLFGADISTVGAMVQMITNGVELGTYRPIDADDEVEIRIRYPEEYRDIKNMDSLRVNTPLGSVPISNFVSRTADQRKIQIDRTDGYRQITVKANVLINPVTNEKYPIAEAMSEIQLWLDEENFGPEYLFRFRGSSEEEEAAAGFLGNAMLGGLALMFIILLLQFNSFYYAILTLTTVASSSIGVLIGLMATGEQFIVVFSGVGIVALAGIVVNNSIVLIDTHQRLEKSGIELKEAVLRAAGQRIRPILITTGTTIIGLLPMAMGTSINIFTRSIELNNPISAWWTNMSISIVFGLGFSTVLTLITIPVLIMLPDYLRKEVFPKFKQQYAVLRNG